MRKQYLFIVIVICLMGCSKDFLEDKPDKALLVPTTLSDFQALLDNTIVMTVVPSLHVIAGDELNVTTNGSTLNAIQRNAYFWEDDVYEATSNIPDWSTPYKQVFYANIVLDGLSKLNRLDDPSAYDYIKGSALFIRAHAFYQIAQVFAPPFSPSTAASLEGIPLVLSSDVNIRPGRGTLEETYARITEDLSLAYTLLPINVPFKSRPNRPAALALLARTYLVMQDYFNAFKFADMALSFNSQLLDFNTLNSTAASPFPVVLPNGNEEVLYFSQNVSYAILSSSIVKLSEDIKNSYDSNDLRKTLFISPTTGRYRGYIGIANDEVYLIRAESNCRLDRLQEANADVNTLLVKRYQSGKFLPILLMDKEKLLQRILLERRKELINRGTRWSDLRRLNQFASTAIELKRVRDGVEIFLKPNSPKYTFPIPLTELGEGVGQNIR